jgi:predicted transposase YbfD/YdcC
VGYYITAADMDAKRFGEATRKHWGIESVFHWKLDVSFREDDCQKYINNSAVNFSYIRRTPLSLIKRDKKTKGRVRNKQKRASWDEEYLAAVLAG